MALEAVDRRQVTSQKDFTVADLKAAPQRAVALLTAATTGGGSIHGSPPRAVALATAPPRAVALAAVKAVPVVAVKAAAVAAVKATAKKSHRCSEFIKLVRLPERPPVFSLIL